MNSKRLFLLSIILLAILTIGAASASEDVSDTMAVVDSPGDDMTLSLDDSVEDTGSSSLDDSNIISENNDDLIADEGIGDSISNETALKTSQKANVLESSDSNPIYGSGETLTIDAPDIYYGQKANITFHLTDGSGNPIANDTLTVYVDNETMGPIFLGNGGYAHLSLSDLSIGMHSVDAMFKGYGPYDSASARATFEVLEVPSNVTNPVLSVSVDGDIYEGESFKVYVTLNDSTGNKYNVSVLFSSDFKNDTVYLTNSRGQFTVNGLSAGNYTYSARTFDINNSTISCNGVIEVLETPMPQPTLEIVLEDVAYADQYFSLRVYLKDSEGYCYNDNVSFASDFWNGTVEVFGGQAIIPVDGLPAGNYSFFAFADTFNATTQGNFAVVEMPNLPPQLYWSISGDVYEGESFSILFELYIGDIPIDGTVHVFSDFSTDSVNLYNGRGQLHIDGLSVGNYTFDAYVYGSGNSSASCSGAFEVLSKPKTETVLDISVDDITLGEEAVVHISLIDANGIPIDGNVRVSADAGVYTVQLSNGETSFNLPNLAVGQYNISASYDGSSDYLPSKDSASFTVSAPIVENNSTVTIENFFTFFNVNGELIQDVDALVFKGIFSIVNTNLTSININRPVEIIGQGASFTNICFNVLSDHVSISNLTMAYTNNIYDYVVSADGVDDFVLKDCIIRYSGTNSANVKKAVSVANSSNVRIADNTINASSGGCIYGLYLSVGSFNISGNFINVSSINNTAYGIYDEGPCGGTIENNEIYADAPLSVYAIYSSPAKGDTNVSFINNNIEAESYFAVGIYDDGETISGNSIELTGNHVVGIVVLSNAEVQGNEINLDATNVGDATVNEEEVPVETAGIVVKNDATISENIVNSNAKSISVLAGSSTISNNELNGAISVESDNNVITNNIINADEEYAIDLGTTTGNSVTNNQLISTETGGNTAVKTEDEENNEIEENIGRQIYTEGNVTIEIFYNNFPIDDGESNIVEVTVPSASSGYITITIGENETFNEDLDWFIDYGANEGSVTYFIHPNNLEGLNPGSYQINVTYFDAINDPVSYAGLINLVEGENGNKDFGYGLPDYVCYLYPEDNALTVEIYNDEISYGQIAVTVFNENGELVSETAKAIDDDLNWKLEELGISEIGCYDIFIKHVSGDDEKIILDNGTLQVTSNQPRYYYEIDVDYPYTVLSLYDASEDTKVYVNGSGPLGGFTLPNNGPLAWTLSDLEIDSPGIYSILIESYDDGNLIDSYEYELIVNDVDDYGEFRFAENYDWDYFTADSPVASLYCPAGSEGDISVEIYNGPNDGSILYTFDDTISSEGYKLWSLSDLGIDESDWNYRMVVKDKDGNVLADYEFGAILYYAIDIYVDENPVGCDSDWLVDICTPPDNEGRVIFMIGDEVYLNATLSSLDATDPDEYGTLHYHFGVANFTKDIAPGHYDNVIVYYIGDDGYQTDSTRFNCPDYIDIYGAEILNISLSMGDSQGIVIVSLTDSDGNPVETEDVQVIINGGEPINLTTDKKGLANITVSGNASIFAYYTNPDGSISSDTLKVYLFTETEKISSNATISLLKDGDNVVISLSDSNGPISGANLSVLVDGVETTVNATDSKGKTTLPVSGNATVIASYVDANGITVSSSISIISNTEIEEVEKIVNNTVYINQTVVTEKIVYLNNTVEVPVEVEKIVYVNSTTEIPIETEKIVYLNNTVEVPVEVEKVINNTVYLNNTVEVPVEVEKIVYVNSTTEIPIETEKIVYINNTVEVPVEVERIVYVNNTVEVPNRTATRIIYSNMKTTAVAKVDGRVGKYFEVTLVDEKGNPLSDKLVQIGFNGAVYNRTTNATGGVRLQINLGYEGKYTFAIAFLGDDNYTGDFQVALIEVTKHSPKLTAPAKTYKASAKTKALTATFKSANGNAISGKKISFTINGKTYTATTNSKGVATVKISLNKKGTYQATAKYAGDGMYKATSTKFKVKIS